jgi:predicted deacetylase
MALSSSQYLIRIDDLCPTMLSDPRERFFSLLARYQVAPILAVVPDNQDPDLKLQPPDTEFWDRMRSYQAAGATIAMHGYRHLCTSRGKSLLRLQHETEFAGVNESRQRDWIRRGLEILRGYGLNPRLFVAPRHGFDRCTLRSLAREGLGVLSDGLALRTFTRHDILWIPQQLWEPVVKSTGLWTICIHTNTATKNLEDRLEKFLDAHAEQFTAFNAVIADRFPDDLRWGERLAESIECARIKISAAKTRMLHAS